MKCLFCPNDGEKIHHCFWKSQYFGKDKNGNWNIVPLCWECHSELHRGRKDMDKYCKQLALSRYKGKNRESLEKIMKEKFYSVGVGF